MNRTIKLRESELRNLIAESVKRILMEDFSENSDEEIIMEVLTSCSDSEIVSLQFLEKKYQMLRRILNSDLFDDNDQILEPYLKDIITIELNGSLYGAFDVILKNHQIYVEFGSMRKFDAAMYTFDGEFDIDEKTIPLETFRQINQQEYEKLVKRFKYVLYEMETKHRIY